METLKIFERGRERGTENGADNQGNGESV